MEDRNEKLQSYVRRLSEGEDLESVRKDFVENFKDVDASEIMKAEQELMKSGVSYKDVQRLCDVHSALFHGATRQEKIANAEKAVNDSLRRQTEPDKGTSGADGQGAGNDVRKAAKSKMTMLQMVMGHPVNVFTKENGAIEKKIGEIREVLENPEASYGQKRHKFEEIRPLSTHYAKKGDLLYPLLNARYGISGPSQVMWGVDDEIRDEISALCGKEMQEEEWNVRAKKVLQRADEMIFKEQNILLPICVQNFTEEEWRQMARDLQDYDPCFTDRIPMWKEAEETEERNVASAPTQVLTPDTDADDVSRHNATMDNTGTVKEEKEEAASGSESGEIVLPSGHFTKEQLRAMLNTLPVEISFVDDKDINRYFNEGPKVFKRPLAALDREVYYCHPPKVEEMVRMMIGQFRNGTRKSFEVWMEKKGSVFLVRYLAVYDDKGKFVGTMEVVENMDGAKKHFESPVKAAKREADEKPEW